MVSASSNAANADAARRWVPWLAAYTGAKFTQLFRLRREDCVSDEDGWSIVVREPRRPEPYPRSRTVPLHSHLVDLGFPEFVRSRTAGPLFVSGGQDAEAALGGLVKLVRRSTPGGATNLQHRFVTEMRRAGATPAEMDAILKFDPPPNKFWSKMPLAYLREAIDKLPRFQLDVG